MEKKPIEILVVDDSKVARDLLGYIINNDPELKVVGFAENGEQALEWLEHHSADVISMDIIMPGISGLEVTRRIMHSKPVPIVIISSAYVSGNETHSFEAIEAGALAILEKPIGLNDESFYRKAAELTSTIKMISDVKLVKRRSAKSTPSVPILSKTTRSKEPIEAVAIGASLGGPLALSILLAELNASFPTPIFIVQHIAAGFTKGFVQWLQSFTSLRVQLASDGERAVPGTCYIAPARVHMEVHREDIISLTHSPTDLLQPSIARLFASMANAYGPRSIGVMLTGMGRDGAEELLLMRQRGALTIAQDRNSCIMFSMPQEAIALGAVQHIIPLNQIADALNTATAVTADK